MKSMGEALLRRQVQEGIDVFVDYPAGGQACMVYRAVNEKCVKGKEWETRLVT